MRKANPECHFVHAQCRTAPAAVAVAGDCEDAEAELIGGGLDEADGFAGKLWAHRNLQNGAVPQANRLRSNGRQETP